MSSKSAARAATAREDIVPFIIGELEKVNPEKILLNEATDMATELKIDSLAVMDLMFAIEEHFDVSIPLNDLADIRTIGQLAEMVEKIAREGGN